MAASRGRVGRLGPHFLASEFRCHHCGAAVVVDELVQVLERIRAHIGRPLPVVSGYRCPIHNAAVGGATDSQHMYGTAADLPSGLVAIGVADHAGARGIGSRGGWAVHVDVRRGPKARWTY